MIPTFRVWDEKDKRMLYPGDYTMEIDDYGVHVLGNHNQVISVDEDENLMQSTGAFDKRDVEIYEGDIVRFNFPYGKRQRAIGVVVLRDDEACFGLDIDSSDEKLRLYRDGRYFEVIGNKYEQPHLLKEDE
ncbi:hypothetical protein CD122_10060 [Staphylococcus rostri]|uniref:YopX protein domain-containing protein n=1 Tax=Staphylococcus rostri TaxID=522262 RepID=A0A2K3YIB8_9STAP|nr:YopX family protein [Staphylococcus rostri]PNZ25329.1 hypothetical protein CD122_10060 [Staphylococcus rostri]